ncbi:hypothetical protein [Hymenobacter sp. BT190]|uniref:hypothetical protein n=1 Tax=Hymenobacter sp. BT190 TaxID=2763505 RepID=UPI001651889E|nr:hypothetical protein [Hymenobacter sp. BT190]MBC6698380.1 hypothetical protein [Hymenobacter sp. BT190]
MQDQQIAEALEALVEPEASVVLVRRSSRVVVCACHRLRLLKEVRREIPFGQLYVAFRHEMQQDRNGVFVNSQTHRMACQQTQVAEEPHSGDRFIVSQRLPETSRKAAAGLWDYLPANLSPLRGFCWLSMAGLHTYRRYAASPQLGVATQSPFGFSSELLVATGSTHGAMSLYYLYYFQQAR